MHPFSRLPLGTANDLTRREGATDRDGTPDRQRIAIRSRGPFGSHAGLNARTRADEPERRHTQPEGDDDTRQTTQIE